jgi:hypothetical protein
MHFLDKSNIHHLPSYVEGECGAEKQPVMNMEIRCNGCEATAKQANSGMERHRD